MKEAISAAKKAGFSVYMINDKATWLYFTDGTNIGYIQKSSMSHTGYRGATVHKPCLKHGTGFAVEPPASLDRDQLVTLFAVGPSWARDFDKVKKWKNWSEFHNSCEHNKNYMKV